MVHECHMCGEVADSHQALRTHMWTHLSKSSYRCMECGAKYPKAAELDEHIAVEHGEPVRGARDEDEALDVDVVEDRAGEDDDVLDVVDRVVDVVQDRAGDRVPERAGDTGEGPPEEASETGAVPVEAQAANIPLVDLTLDDGELTDSLEHLVKTPPPSPPPTQPAPPPTPPTPPLPAAPCSAVDPPQSTTGSHPHFRGWVRDSVELPLSSTEDTDIVRQDADSTVPDKDPVSDAPLRKRGGPRRRRPRASARSSVEGAAESTSGSGPDVVREGGRLCQQTAPDDAAPAPPAEQDPAFTAPLDEAAMTMLGMSLKDLPRSVVAPERGRYRRTRYKRPAAGAADVAVQAKKKRPASRPRFAAKRTKPLAGASILAAAFSEGPALLVADAEGTATPPAADTEDLPPPNPVLAEAVVEPKKKRPASRGARTQTAPKRGPKSRLALADVVEAEADTGLTATLPMPVAEEPVQPQVASHGVVAEATAQPVLAEAAATRRPGPKRGPKSRLALADVVEAKAEAETVLTATLPMPVAEEPVQPQAASHGVVAVATAQPVLAEAEATRRPGPKRARRITKKRPGPVASGLVVAVTDGSAPDARPDVRRGRGRPSKASLKAARHRITMSVCDEEQDPLDVETVARPPTPTPPARWVDRLVRQYTAEREAGWKCCFCPSVFAKGQELSCECHVMGHLGYSDRTCPGCGMAFPSPDERQDHQRRIANTHGPCAPR